MVSGVLEGFSPRFVLRSDESTTVGLHSLLPHGLLHGFTNFSSVCILGGCLARVQAGVFRNSRLVERILIDLLEHVQLCLYLLVDRVRILL